MTEPLIDRDTIRAAIYQRVIRVGTLERVADMATDDVLDYLRSVLTPEALGTGSQSAWDVGVVDGGAAYRRIFGKDG